MLQICGLDCFLCTPLGLSTLAASDATDWYGLDFLSFGSALLYRPSPIKLSVGFDKCWDHYF